MRKTDISISRKGQCFW